LSVTLLPTVPVCLRMQQLSNSFRVGPQATIVTVFTGFILIYPSE
jgi:hypothetical protein